MLVTRALLSGADETARAEQGRASFVARVRAPRRAGSRAPTDGLRFQPRSGAGGGPAEGTPRGRRCGTSGPARPQRPLTQPGPARQPRLLRQSHPRCSAAFRSSLRGRLSVPDAAATPRAAGRPGAQRAAGQSRGCTKPFVISGPARSSVRGLGCKAFRNRSKELPSPERALHLAPQPGENENRVREWRCRALPEGDARNSGVTFGSFPS